MTTADDARKEAEFLFWFLPKNKQPKVPEDMSEGKLAQMDADHFSIMALGKTAHTMTHNDPAGDRLVDYCYGEEKYLGEIANKPFRLTPIDDGRHVVSRQTLVKTLQAMTSDWVRFQFADCLFVVDGMIGEKEAAVMIAPRIEEDE